MADADRGGQLNLRAVNTGGDIGGNYAGNATIKSTNEMKALGGEMTAPQSGSSGSVKITVENPDTALAPLGPSGDDDLAPLTPNEEDALAPLTPNDDDALAPLVPDKMPSWTGGGSIKMTSMAAGGVASGHIGGYGGSRAVSNTSNLPVKIGITGTSVTLTVTFPGVGTATFRGFIRGEGK